MLSACFVLPNPPVSPPPVIMPSCHSCHSSHSSPCLSFSHFCHFVALFTSGSRISHMIPCFTACLLDWLDLPAYSWFKMPESHRLTPNHIDRVGKRSSLSSSWPTSHGTLSRTLPLRPLLLRQHRHHLLPLSCPQPSPIPPMDRITLNHPLQSRVSPCPCLPASLLEVHR